MSSKDTELRDITAGTDRYVQLLIVFAGDDVPRPVTIVLARRQVGDLLTVADNSCLSCLVGKSPDRVGVGYIKPVVDHGHPKRLREVLEKNVVYLNRPAVEFIS